MNNYHYYPFNNNFELIDASDLEKLKEISEGWYIDYKSESIKPKSIGKHLASFANQYGGFLFFGINEDDNGSRKAGSFPGISTHDVSNILQAVREAASAHINPPVFYEEKIVEGPAENIQLAGGKSVIIIGIPEGMATPYVHSSGKIYRRIADQSFPKEETDRSVLDLLWNKGEKNKRAISNLMNDIPLVPRELNNFAWVYVHYLQNPFGFRPLRKINFGKFKEILQRNRDKTEASVLMDSIFSAAEGFIARHVQDNDADYSSLSFRWWHSGHGRIIIPIQLYDPSEFLLRSKRFGYQYSKEFLSIATAQNFQHIRIADFTQFPHLLALLTEDYRMINSEVKGSASFLSRIMINNVGHTSPYYDSKSYLSRIKNNGIPLITDNQILIPREIDIDRLIKFDARPNNIESDIQMVKIYLRPILVIMYTLNACGIINTEDDMSDEDIWTIKGPILPRT